MPKHIQHQYFRHETVGLNPPEGQLDQFIVSAHKDISGCRWKEQAPWSAASGCVMLMTEQGVGHASLAALSLTQAITSSRGVTFQQPQRTGATG